MIEVCNYFGKHWFLQFNFLKPQILSLEIGLKPVMSFPSRLLAEHWFDRFEDSRVIRFDFPGSASPIQFVVKGMGRQVVHVADVEGWAWKNVLTWK